MVHRPRLPGTRRPADAGSADRLTRGRRGRGRLPGMDDGPVLWCRTCAKRFKERLAVDGVGFEVAPGETYGLLGAQRRHQNHHHLDDLRLLRRDGGEVTVAKASLDRDDRPGQGGHRLRAPGRRPLPRPERAGEPPLLGADVRADRPGAEGAGRRHPGGRRAGRAVRRQGGRLLGRHAAAAQHRRRAATGPAAGPGRADGRGRPAEPQRHPRQRRGAGRRRRGRALHHPLHGGGRAALRPGRDHRPGPPGRRGHPPRAGGDRGERDRIELAATGDLAGLAGVAARLDGVDEAGVVAGGVHLVAGTAAGCCRGCWSGRARRGRGHQRRAGRARPGGRVPPPDRQGLRD